MATVFNQPEKYPANPDRAIGLVGYICVNLEQELAARRKGTETNMAFDKADIIALVPAVLEAMRQETDVRKENALDEQIAGFAELLREHTDVVSTSASNLTNSLDNFGAIVENTFTS
jgi:hypothetical protein